MVNGAADADRPLEPAWIWYVISFLVPMAGVILGALFLARPGQASKRFGKNCVVAAAASIAAIIICWVLYAAFILVVVVLSIKYGGV